MDEPQAEGGSQAKDKPAVQLVPPLLINNVKRVARRSQHITGMIQRLLKDVVSTIDSKLEAHPTTFGENHLSVGLPTMLQIPGMSLPDAQILIYAAAIRSLQAAGYDVEIELQSNRSAVHLRWHVSIDARQLDDARELIAKCRMSDVSTRADKKD